MGLFRLSGRTRRSLGMDIDDRIVLSEVAWNRSNTQCRGFAILDPFQEEIQPEDMVLDERVRPFASSLRTFVRKQRLAGRKVAISPPSEHVTVRLLSLPPVPKPLIRNTVVGEIGKRLILPFEDPLLDVAQIPSTIPLASTEPGFTNVLVVAASKAMVWPWVELSTHVGLRPISLEPGMFAVVRLLRRELPPESIALVVVLGFAGFDLGLVVSGIPIFVRFVGVRIDDYAVEKSWDRLSYAEDVSGEIDRSIAFMDFTVLGGTSARIGQVMVVDRVGCGDVLVSAIRSRIELPVHMPTMPYSVNANNRLGQNPAGATHVDADVATLTSVSVGLTVPEVTP